MLLALLTSLCAFTGTLTLPPSSAADVHAIAVTSDTASARTSSPDIDNWFADLITLNPTATVVTAGQAIAVSRTGGLTLPPGPVPTGVTLN
jgi:hypothetical protein